MEPAKAHGSLVVVALWRFPRLGHWYSTSGKCRLTLSQAHLKSLSRFLPHKHHICGDNIPFSLYLYHYPVSLAPSSLLFIYLSLSLFFVSRVVEDGDRNVRREIGGSDVGDSRVVLLQGSLVFFHWTASVERVLSLYELSEAFRCVHLPFLLYPNALKLIKQAVRSSTQSTHQIHSNGHTSPTKTQTQTHTHKLKPALLATSWR